jgi:hypothetical protein
MRGIKEREVVACIISMLLCYNSKDTAASWRASMTMNWLRVLGTAELPHIDQGVRH